MKDVDALFRKLARAERHVLDGRKVVERQRAFISARKEARHDTSYAEKLLDTFERTLAVFEENYRAVRTETEKSQ
jgi:hypothetical protein